MEGFEFRTCMTDCQERGCNVSMGMWLDYVMQHPSIPPLIPSDEGGTRTRNNREGEEWEEGRELSVYASV